MFGTVTRLFHDKGFGFIRPADDPGSRDIFFHCTALRALDFDDTLLERRVEFGTEMSPHGLRATNVQAAS